MANYCKVCAGDLDEVSFHLEEVYGNAQWALRYGATKESLLSAIEEAVELHEDSLGKEGWLIVTPPTDDSQSPA